MKLYAIFLILSFGFGACNIDSTSVNSRTALSSKNAGDQDGLDSDDDVQRGNNGAEDDKEKNKKKRLDGGGNDGGDNGAGLGLTLHRCGASYDTSFVAATITHHTWQTTDRDGTKIDRSITSNYRSSLKATGSVSEANFSIATILNSFTQVNNSASKESIEKEVKRWDGTYDYKFFAGVPLTQLKQRSTDWRDVECGILPVQSVTRKYATGETLTAVAANGFPSLVAPNAAADVYDEYIGDQRWFRNIALTATRVNARGVSSEQAFTVDMVLSRIKKSANVYDIIIETKPTSFIGRTFADMSSLESHYYLMQQGFYPKLTYTIDFVSRKTTNIVAKAVYEHYGYHAQDIDFVLLP